MSRKRTSTTSLRTLLDRSALRKLAGTRAFQRGEAYFAGGQVGEVLENEGVLTAKVQGMRPYRVKLWDDRGVAGHDCSCPIGRDGDFCKHAVAVALAWLETDAGAAARGRRRPPSTLDELRAHLERQDKHVLVDLLVARAIEDDALRRQLQIEAAAHGPGSQKMAACRAAIDAAVNIRGFVDYDDAYDYACGVDAAVDAIETLLRQGQAAEVIELTEHALALLERAIERIDDSDGEMHGLLERLQILHHRACKRAKPDPEALARRLFAWELRSEWDVFHGAAQGYADVLGKRGLAVYRALAEAEWRQVRPLGPGDDDRERYGKRFRITAIMEALARQSGDLEALVAVKQHDLSSAYAFLQIAEIHRQAGQDDAALDWAERGVAAFPECIDPRLHEFIAEAYHRRKRHDEAMTLVWRLFAEGASLERYQQLLAHARRAGQQAAWRERALAHLRQAQTRGTKASSDRYGAGFAADGSLLVRIFLWEKDIDAAWREAQARGCSEALWLELAGKRAKTHPQEALAVYQPRVAPCLDRTNDEAYRQAVTLLRSIRTLMRKLGRDVEFEAYLSNIRTAYKRKRNFIKLLDQTT